MSSQSLNPEKCAICGCIEAMSAHHGANVGFAKAHEFKRGEPAAAAPPLGVSHTGFVDNGDFRDPFGMKTEASPSDPVQEAQQWLWKHYEDCEDDVCPCNSWEPATIAHDTYEATFQLLAAYDQHRNQKLLARIAELEKK